MTLEEITTRLIKADEDYATALTKLMPLEMEYQTRLDDLILSSQRPSQALREAEANQIIRQEPIYVDYQSAKLSAKIAYTRLDTMKAVSANLRNLSYYKE